MTNIPLGISVIRLDGKRYQWLQAGEDIPVNSPVRIDGTTAYAYDGPRYAVAETALQSGDCGWVNIPAFLT